MYNNETELEIINKLKNSLNIPENITNTINITNTVNTVDTVDTNVTSDHSVNPNKHGVGYKKKIKISPEQLKLLNKFQKPKTKKKITKSNKTNEKKELKDDATRLDLIFNNLYYKKRKFSKNTSKLTLK